MATKEEADKPLSQSKKGYFLAFLGGTLGLPVGWVLSPLVLYLLNKYFKGKADSSPNRFRIWAIIGIVAAPMCYLPFVFLEDADQAVSTVSPSSMQASEVRKSDAQKLLAELLGELDEIRKTDEFKFYGLSKAGPYSGWISAARARADVIEMHMIESTAFGYIVNMARSFAIAKGVETASIRQLRQEVQEVIDWKQVDINDSSQWPPSWR